MQAQVRARARVRVRVRVKVEARVSGIFAGIGGHGKALSCGLADFRLPTLKFRRRFFLSAKI